VKAVFGSPVVKFAVDITALAIEGPVVGVILALETDEVERGPLIIGAGLTTAAENAEQACRRVAPIEMRGADQRVVEIVIVAVIGRDFTINVELR